jgi:tRNA-splicing ligase RtcB
MPFETHNMGGIPIKMWLPEGHPLEEEARQQLGRVSRVGFVKDLALMPDGHVGMGSTIGSVIATEGAIMPAAVGVDIGCGMDYLPLTCTVDQLTPDADGYYPEIFAALAQAVPHGRTNHGQGGDRGSWGIPPKSVCNVWRERLSERYERLIKKHPHLLHKFALAQLGTLGSGNHFVEMTVNENGQVGIMLHSGSRGVGNLVGTYFIRRAKMGMKKLIGEQRGIQLGIKHGRLPADTPIKPYFPIEEKNLAYLLEGTEDFDDYMEGVAWAQDYARENRNIMMSYALCALRELTDAGKFPKWKLGALNISCHHNYVAQEEHHGKRLWVTRKGAVRAQEGDLGIIPGSMGAKSYLVQGKGHAPALNSCSHGAGRVMSRTRAKQELSLEKLIQDTAGVTCYKNEGVLDEAPECYKDIEAVMEAQSDMVKVIHTLNQIVCVKGLEL